MIRYILYVLMFAVMGAIIYIWGLKKAQSQSMELARRLYAKCEKLVCKALKEKEFLQKSEMEKIIANVQVGQFFSKNKLAVTNPKEFINVFLEYVIKKGVLEERMEKGKKVYCLKKK